MNEPTDRHRNLWPGLTMLILTLVVVTCVLSALVFVVVNRLFDSNNAQQKLNARTECVREITAEITDERWGAIADILQASENHDPAGVQAGTARLEATKGKQDKRVGEECPSV